MATISATQQQQKRADQQRARADRQQARYNTEIDRLIEESGWAVCVAHGASPQAPAPYFGYTIGRTLNSQPELCTWGRDTQVIRVVLNRAAADLDRTGRTIGDGDLFTVPGVGAWRAQSVPMEGLPVLEFARSRYTFLRAVHLERLL